ncbi:MAG: hypothetical protein ACOY3Y_06120 [Acidobacteriota bacterium]
MRRLTLAVVALTLASAAFAVQPSSDTYIISTGRIAGTPQGGVVPFFVTDVWIHNPSATTSATVEVVFLPRNTDNSAPIHSFDVPVAAGATIELADIFQSGFNLDGVVGALRFVSVVPVVVTGRIYDNNVQTNIGTGTAGQFFPGLPASAAIGSGQSTSVIGTAEDATFRTNLALVETTGNTVTLRFERIEPNGTVGGTIDNYQVLPREAKQIGSVLKQLGVTTATNQRVRVTVTGGTGRVLVAGSRLDNRTGDPYTIEMTMPASSSVRTTGLFEGVVLTPDGGRLDGGLQLTIGTTGIGATEGVTGLPCGSLSFTVDFDATSNPPITIGGDGSFTFTIPNVAYTDGASTIFTITWTVTGARSTEGVVTGTLQSATAGGTGDWATCNGTATRNFRAGWVASN